MNHNERNDAPRYDTSSVFVAVIGRPNVGKSSLTNLLVGEKVAIVTSKPQTTRTRITGVITRGPLQYVLLDTPGVHKAKNKLGKRMDKTASDSLGDVDVSMMLFEPHPGINESEQMLIDALRRSGPAIAVINKIDLVRDPAELEARKAELEGLGVFDQVCTVSVRDNRNCEELFEILGRYAVEGPHYFDDDAYTDMPEKELVAELIREKALLFMRDEIPHGLAVVVERFKERPGTDHGHRQGRRHAEEDRQRGSRRLRGLPGLPGQPAVLGQGQSRLAGQRVPLEQLRLPAGYRPPVTPARTGQISRGYRAKMKSTLDGRGPMPQPKARCGQMDADNCWKAFALTGKISHYLDYRRAAAGAAAPGQGTCNGRICDQGSGAAGDRVRRVGPDPQDTDG